MHPTEEPWVVSDPVDFFSPEFHRDPYPAYARLRTESPVHEHEFQGERRFSLLRYDDISSVLRDTRFGSRRMPDVILEKLLNSGNDELANLARVEANVIVSQDAPAHAQIRGQLGRAFTSRRLAAFEPLIERIVEHRLDAMEVAGRIDLMRDFAVPVPLQVIAALLGVPLRDLTKLERWSDALGALLDPMVRAASGMDSASSSMSEFDGYFRDLIADRRREPGDDLISALVSAPESERLSDDALLVNCAFVLVAGFETTANLIGNGVLALLQHPEELERLRAEPKRIDSALEEILRFDAPIQRISRVAREDVELRGCLIPAGTRVGLVLGAGNRDPERFAEPDRFDLERGDNRHLAFSGGPHFCLGAALARLEGRLALAALLERFPALALDEQPPEWRVASLSRGLTQLPVELTPPRATRIRPGLRALDARA